MERSCAVFSCTLFTKPLIGLYKGQCMSKEATSNPIVFMKYPDSINGGLNITEYSSPMPYIGIYIAIASVVCMLLMFFDIVAGFFNRKQWVPCKLFTLNSVTLTLLSITAKIPFDLTTKMPNTNDQLSKLCGTALICISFGFLLPSIGLNNESECVTNLVAVTIFGITMAVHIFLQMHIGVIFLFKTQHRIIMGCMLVLLALMWSSSWSIHNFKRTSHFRSKTLFVVGNGSMLHRLKKSYLFGYCANSQLKLGTSPFCFVCGIICLLCSATLLSSIVFRKHWLHQGVCGYGNSIDKINIAQTLGVVVGSLATIIRCFTLSEIETSFLVKDLIAEDIIRRNPTMQLVPPVLMPFKLLQYACINFVKVIILYPMGLVHTWWRIIVKENLNTKNWKLQKAKEDMKRWMVSSRSESCTHLSHLLVRTSPSPQINSMELRDQDHPSEQAIQVSSLSIVLLVRIAEVSLPEKLSRAIVLTYAEVEGIIHFLDKTLNPYRINDNNLLFAKAVWEGNDFTCLLSRFLNVSTYEEEEPDLNYAIEIITKLKNILPSDPVWDKLGTIVDFINHKTYSSIEELRTSLEQMFVDMLHIMLARLPYAISINLNDGPAEEYHVRVKLALKLLCQVESTEAQIQWSFPNWSNISRLITTGTPIVDNV